MSEGLADVLTLDIIDGQLVLTVSASRVRRCFECEDFHILLLDQATPRGLLTLAAGIAHLAEHHAERVTP